MVCRAKYRRAVFSAAVDDKLKEVCQEISKRYEITFLEIGTDKDHVHFFVQSVRIYSPKKLVQIIKRITAREILGACPEVKKYLWGGSVLDGWLLPLARLGNTAPSRRSSNTSNNKAQESRNNSTSSDTPQLAAAQFILFFNKFSSEPNV